MIGTPTRIDVTAFGADPTGSRDSAPAIREAFAAAGAAKGAVIVEFPHGRYDIWPESAEQRELYVSNTVGADQRYRVKTLGILIENTKDLSVIGNDSTLIYHGRQTTIAIVDSERVRLTGLTIDFAVPTVIDATVVETGVVAGHAFRILSVPLTNPFRIDGNSIVWHGEVSRRNRGGVLVGQQRTGVHPGSRSARATHVPHRSKPPFRRCGEYHGHRRESHPHRLHNGFTTARCGTRLPDASYDP